MKHTLKKSITNFKGVKTNRKIVVIEVDDYGWSNVLSPEIHEKLKPNTFGNRYFVLNDRLESGKDLEMLFEVLNKHKDKNGRGAVFTPLTVMTNLVRKTDNSIEEFEFEPFLDTIDRFYGKESVNLWKEGISNKLFLPQYHGFEHINYELYLQMLKLKGGMTNQALNEGVIICLDKMPEKYHGKKYSAAYDFITSEEYVQKCKRLIAGLELFEKQIGYKAVLLTPPGGGYSYEYNNQLVRSGIKYVQLGNVHKITDIDGNQQKQRHYFGMNGNNGVTYIPRNCQFEPHSPAKVDWVDACLRDIEMAFFWNKPAMVSTHRINFVNQSNAKNGNGIKKLDELLARIKKKWPDVEFMGSSEMLANVFVK
ncbi:MAG: hypothetical protein ACPGRC_04030 [Salibacteraceae bacterium]